MKDITVQDLKNWKESNKDFQLIDVREHFEHEICELGGLLIPLNEIPSRYTEISKDKEVVIHCKSGMRSMNAIAFLEQQFGFSNLYNLRGGIMAWAKEIDPTMEQY